MMWHALNSFFFLICNALSMPVLGPITRSLPPPLTKKESPSSVESLIITINNTNININITIMTTNKTRWWTFVQSCGLSSCLWRPAFQISETLWAPLDIAWIRCSYQTSFGRWWQLRWWWTWLLCDKLILLNLTQNPGDPGLPTSTHLPHRLHRLPCGLWQVACYNHLKLPSCRHHVIVHPNHRG